MGFVWNWDVAAESLPHLMQGLWVTLLATGGGMALALVGGLIFAVLRRSQSAWLSWPTVGAIEFIRSTPLLIQLYFVFYLLPDYGWNTPLVVGILILGLHYSTYTSEGYRAGIDAVGRGQWEAATALNLTPTRTWLRIILPQAIPPVIPALGNNLVAMFKDTPLLYAITVLELFARAQNFNARVGSNVESYTIVGIIFLVLSLLTAGLIRWFERHYVLRNA